MFDPIRGTTLRAEQGEATQAEAMVGAKALGQKQAKHTLGQQKSSEGLQQGQPEGHSGK